MRKKVDKQLNFLAQDPRHPSLQTRKLIGDIWYFRIDQSYRATFQWDHSTITLRNVDSHDEVLGQP